MQRTLALIKPDAVSAGHIGEIVRTIQESGLRILALKMLRWTPAQAEGFYHVHKDKPFFQDLVRFMSSGPFVAMVLEGEDAISRWRDLMGPTDSTKAPKDTIRGRFGTNIERNAVHGSDGTDTAAFEISYCFAGMELSVW